MSALLAALYILCLLFLIGFAIFIVARDPRARLNRYFALLSLALLGWVASLFAFDFPLRPDVLLWVGRLNFACIVFAVTLGGLFVRQVARRRASVLLPWVWAETALLGAATLLTPLVDRQELVQAGEHVTAYGPLFPLYVFHVLALVAAMLWTAFRPPLRLPTETRLALRFTGFGILATAAVALVTNALLPYVFGDFRLIHVGTVSTLLFLAGVGYAVFAHHLFNIRVIVRAAFVYAGLIALALELYSLALSGLAHLLPFGSPSERTYAATAVALTVNAFTHEPVRRWLERIAERLLTPVLHQRHPRRSLSPHDEGGKEGA